MTRRDARLLTRLREHAAIVRPQLLRRFGLEPRDASPELFAACEREWPGLGAFARILRVSKRPASEITEATRVG